MFRPAGDDNWRTKVLQPNGSSREAQPDTRQDSRYTRMRLASCVQRKGSARVTPGSYIPCHTCRLLRESCVSAPRYWNPCAHQPFASARSSRSTHVRESDSGKNRRAVTKAQVYSISGLSCKLELCRLARLCLFLQNRRASSTAQQHVPTSKLDLSMDCVAAPIRIAIATLLIAELRRD
jgi:hypothetical protein